MSLTKLLEKSGKLKAQPLEVDEKLVATETMLVELTYKVKDTKEPPSRQYGAGHLAQLVMSFLDLDKTDVSG